MWTYKIYYASLNKEFHCVCKLGFSKRVTTFGSLRTMTSRTLSSWHWGFTCTSWESHKTTLQSTGFLTTLWGYNKQPHRPKMLGHMSIVFSPVTPKQGGKKYQKEHVLLHCTHDPCQMCSASYFRQQNLLSWLGQNSQSAQGWSDLFYHSWSTFVMAGTKRVIECHDSWQPHVTSRKKHLLVRHVFKWGEKGEHRAFKMNHKILSGYFVTWKIHVQFPKRDVLYEAEKKKKKTPRSDSNFILNFKQTCGSLFYCKYRPQH